MLAVFLSASCAGHADHDHDEHGHAEESHAGHSDEIILSPEKAKAAGVVVDTVKAGTFRDVIETGGQILAAQGDESQLVANVSGVISFPRPVVDGVSVKKGEALFTISSGNLQNGDEIKRARIAYETAKDGYDRAKSMREKNIVSEAEFNTIRETYENARIAYEALSPSEDGKGVAVKSPYSGYVKNLLVKDGEFVALGTPLAAITKTERLQLRADVSERYYAYLPKITSANIRVPSVGRTYQLDELQGRLLSYGKASGDSSYYIPVTFEFRNTGDLVPGAFVEVYLLSKERENVISLPVSAITEEQGLYFVYVRLDEEGYKKQEVKLGATDGERVEVISGLTGGEQVVMQGAIYVKLSSASNAIPAHTHNH